MSEDPIEMGKRLYQARLRAGFPNATSAAQALKVPEPTYLAHENGSRGFRATASRYAKFFGVRLEWLLTGRGTESLDPIAEVLTRIPDEKRPQALEFLEFLAEPRGQRRQGAR